MHLRRLVVVVVLMATACSTMSRSPSSPDSPQPWVNKGNSIPERRLAPEPVIEQIIDAGTQTVLWKTGQPIAPSLKAGQLIWIVGRNFGAGPLVDESSKAAQLDSDRKNDLAKLVFGNVRALERDVTMYRGVIDLVGVVQAIATMTNIYKEYPGPSKSGGTFSEKSIHWPQTWPKDIESWQDGKIVTKVPITVKPGSMDLVIQVQKRLGFVRSRGVDLTIPDPLRERVEGYGSYGGPDVMDEHLVGIYDSPSVSKGVRIQVANVDWENARAEGERIYWMFDFNTGLTHYALKTNFRGILAGTAENRMEPQKGKFDPRREIGAIAITDATAQGLPAIVTEKSYAFRPSPMPSPLKLVSNDVTVYPVTPQPYVGYVDARYSNFPPGKHIGFSCAVCHAAEVKYQTYASVSGGTPVAVTQVFNGIPNPYWSMRFAAVTPTIGVKSHLDNPVVAKNPLPYINGHSLRETLEETDKSLLFHHIYKGTADSSLLRDAAEVGSFFRNDFLYSPIAIPIITQHTPVRRALSRSEHIAGFEGSYTHSEEPDGAFGAHTLRALQSFTTYMGTLGEQHDLLVRIGLYKWLSVKHPDELKSKTSFVEADWNTYRENARWNNAQQFEVLNARIAKGREAFQRKCETCHSDNFGTHTDENMMPLKDVGSYFSPTAWHRQMGSIRTAMIRDLFWVQKRGMLHDGHVRDGADNIDSAMLLVNPDRCNTGSDLYRDMYTVGGKRGFKIPKSSMLDEKSRRAQDAAVKHQRHFVEVGNDFVWDYQANAHEVSNFESGQEVSKPKSLAAAPHPWCASDMDEADALVHYMLTL